MIKLWIFLILCYFCTLTTCARIFGAFPMPMISHQVVFMSLIEKLGERGHDITILTTDPVDYKGKYPNIRQIDVHNGSYEIWTSIFDYNKIGEIGVSNIQFQTWISEAMIKLTDHQLSNPEMDLLLIQRAKFDVCIIESWVEPMFAIKDIFKCKLILMSTLTASMPNFDAFGNPSNPILYMDLLLPYYGDLNFWQRMRQVYNSVIIRLHYYLSELPKYETYNTNRFGSKATSISTIHNNADLLFISGHPIFTGPRPIVPNIIYINGIHIKNPTPLPNQDLKQILDRSDEGVIYFSLGSNVKSSNLNRAFVKAFLDCFRELPFTIIWKWENEKLDDKPDNVHIKKWMPQQGILAHSNVKLFITQGGLQSVEEAINYKVPIIVMPFVIDQFANAAKIKSFGIGEILYLKNLTKNVIKDTILDVINNNSYNKNIVHLSNLFNDQPQTGLEKAIWWTEYLIRNGNVKHLRSPSADTPFYKYFFIDLLLVIFLFVSAFIHLTRITISFVSRKYFNRNKNKKD